MSQQIGAVTHGGPFMELLDGAIVTRALSEASVQAPACSASSEPGQRHGPPHPARGTGPVVLWHRITPRKLTRA